jgi:hypothetical protein
MEFCFSFVERFSKEGLDAYPSITNWLLSVRTRPAYQRMWAVAAPKVNFGR